MQTVFRSSIEHISSPRRPFGVAQIAGLTLEKICTEMPPEIRARTRRPQEFSRARAIEARIVMEQFLRQIGIVARQTGREIR